MCRENGKIHQIPFQGSQFLFTYDFDSVALDKVDSIKDLGIPFDSKLNFHEHMDNSILLTTGGKIKNAQNHR